MAYAAISAYWGLGGTWLLDTVGGSLETAGRSGTAGLLAAVWAAAVLKVVGAMIPVLYCGLSAGRFRPLFRPALPRPGRGLTGRGLTGYPHDGGGCGCCGS